MLGLGMMTGTVSSAQADAAAVAMGLIVVGNGQYMTREALDRINPNGGFGATPSVTTHSSTSSSSSMAPVVDAVTAAYESAKQAEIATSAAASSVTSSLNQVATAADPLSSALLSITTAVGDAQNNLVSSTGTAAMAMAEFAKVAAPAAAAWSAPVTAPYNPPSFLSGLGSHGEVVSTGPGGVMVNINVTGNTVASDSSAANLANHIASAMTSQLRTVAGLKM